MEKIRRFVSGVVVKWAALKCEFFVFFSSRRRHTRLQGDWSSDVCSSDLETETSLFGTRAGARKGRNAFWLKSTALKLNSPERFARSYLPATSKLPPESKPCQIGRASCRERV